MDKGQPVSSVMTLDAVYEERSATPRFNLMLLSRLQRWDSRWLSLAFTA